MSQLLIFLLFSVLTQSLLQKDLMKACELRFGYLETITRGMMMKRSWIDFRKLERNDSRSIPRAYLRDEKGTGISKNNSFR